MEVHHNGEWGTVCGDEWDLNDAQVVCSELNFGNAIAAQHHAFFGEGSGEIWLDNLNCVGNESTIGECSHRGWGIEYCRHSEDASVKCSAGNISAKHIPYSGLFTRGEYFTNAQWCHCSQGKFSQMHGS